MYQVKNDLFRGKLLLFLLANFLPAYAFFQLASLNTLSSQLLSFFPAQPGVISNLSFIYLLADAIFLVPAGFLLDRFDLKYIFITICPLLLLGVFLTNTHYSLEFLYSRE